MNNNKIDEILSALDHNCNSHMASIGGCDEPNIGYEEAKKELQEYITSIVERVIASAEDVGKEIDKGIFNDRKKIERKQRQTYQAIKDGKIEAS